MELCKVMDFINEIEKRFPVDQWVVNGIHIWPLIRISLGFQLQFIDEEHGIGGTYKKKKVNKFYNLASIITKSIYASYKDSKNNDIATKKADIIFLTPNVTRTFHTENGYYDTICGPFIESFQKQDRETLVLEFGTEFYPLPRDGKSIFIQKDLEYIKIKSRLLNKFGMNRPKVELCKFEEFIMFLKESVYDVNIYSMSELCREVLVIRNLADFFKEKLRKSNATVGLAVCYYTYIGMAFNLACRELNITSVDIQHGTQGIDNVTYGKWNRIPGEGYELLPKKFWCWNADDANVIKKWADKVEEYHQPLVGGNLWINMWKDSSMNEIVQSYDEKVKMIIKPEKDTHILFTMQTGQLLPKIIIKTIQNSPISWQWWIRLHPSMTNEREKIKMELQDVLGGVDILFDEAIDLPLPALLRHMHLHITEWSAVILEAEMMGLPSIAVNKWAGEYFPKQCLAETLIIVNESQNLIEVIKQQLENKINISIDNNKISEYAAKSLIKLLNVCEFDAKQ